MERRVLSVNVNVRVSSFWFTPRPWISFSRPPVLLYFEVGLHHVRYLLCEGMGKEPSPCVVMMFIAMRPCDHAKAWDSGIQGTGQSQTKVILVAREKQRPNDEPRRRHAKVRSMLVISTTEP